MAGKGDTIDFWCDNWSGEGALILANFRVPDFYPKFSEVLINGVWELEGVAQYMEDSLLQQINSYHITLSDREDRLVWKHTTLGNFSVKTAWNLIRSEGQLNVTTTSIWRQAVPPSS